LDAVVGRSGSVYKSWLTAQPDGFGDGVEQAALDPFGDMPTLSMAL
jgi:hypothetical protein